MVKSNPPIGLKGCDKCKQVFRSTGPQVCVIFRCQNRMYLEGLKPERLQQVASVQDTVISRKDKGSHNGRKYVDDIHKQSSDCFSLHVSDRAERAQSKVCKLTHASNNAISPPGFV